MAVVPNARPPETAGPPGPDAFGWAPALRERRRAEGQPPISAIVHTRNEERFVATAIASLGWVDEIVVVDMESDDATVAIAETMGARVETFENVGYVEPARRFGIAQASHGWVLLLDADEWIEEPLAETLGEIAAFDAADVVDLPFKSWLCGDWLRGTGWAGESHPRFFKAGYVDWPAHVHAQPVLGGRVAKLERAPGHEVCHWNYDDLHEFVDKLNRYTSREADRIAPLSWSAAIAAARGELDYRWTPELDGTRSVALSLAMVAYRLIAHAKAWERAGFPDVGAPATVAEVLRSFAAPSHAAALASYAAGDMEGAAGRLRSAVDVDVLNDLAVVEAARGNTGEAKTLLQACLVVSPEHADALANLAAVDAPPASSAMLPPDARRIHLGCGDKHLPGFVNIDVRATPSADLVLDLNDFTLEGATIDLAYSNAFLEHLYRDKRGPHLASVHRALADGGAACYTGIPYFKAVAKAYLAGGPGTCGERFDIYNAYRYTHGDPDAQTWYFEQLHKSLFDEDELARLLTEAGFESFIVFAYGFPGDYAELPVTMGFYAVKGERGAAELERDARAFLSLFDGTELRLSTLEVIR